MLNMFYSHWRSHKLWLGWGARWKFLCHYFGDAIEWCHNLFFKFNFVHNQFEKAVFGETT